MPNPYLPGWEYIPDGEPRVFNDRVYVYGSHDRTASDKFCDYKLKVWSAPCSDLNHWVCHGDIFHTRPDRDHDASVSWSDKELYAPDVIEKDGKYYLYAYIVDSLGCVAVADAPEGPFRLLHSYHFQENREIYGNGSFIDPGVLVDDDGRVYMYCGFLRSFLVQVNPDNMYEIIEGSCIENIIPALPDDEAGFFEACSPRKIGSRYYLIYSPNRGSRLAYMTSDSPAGPFSYQGYLIDNGVDYPGGNNHGSICQINGEWYLFYHRMTNGTIMSRRGCVEKITILPDGTIPTVEMTSLGFETSLNPYEKHSADIACYLTGGCFVTEKNPFCFTVTGITDGCVIGYKYFDFGTDKNNRTMKLLLSTYGCGCNAKVDVFLDDPKTGRKIGCCHIGTDDGIYEAILEKAEDRHAVFFVVQQNISGSFEDMFSGRYLFELAEFVFLK
ncbi:MAG: family 43 glycosylhydrolase [Clostridiaceae bacterium]|nr:family 43 glycosylhydrolase [Clostridiaceae bacterium]